MAAGINANAVDNYGFKIANRNMDTVANANVDDIELDFEEAKHLEELAKAIERIESEIGNSSNLEFEAYKLAREQNPTYVSSRDFTIGFLRAEAYDADMAARQILRYFKMMLDLLGPEMLTRDILLDDLAELQVLPEPDAAGGRIVLDHDTVKQLANRTSNCSSRMSDVTSASQLFNSLRTSNYSSRISDVTSASQLFNSLRTSNYSSRMSDITSESQLFNSARISDVSSASQLFNSARTSDVSASQIFNSLRTSDGSITQLLNSMRTSDQSMKIDFDFTEDPNGLLTSLDMMGEDTSESDNTSSGSNACMDDVTESENMNESISSISGDEISSRDILLGRGRHSHEGNTWLRDLISQEYENYESSDKNGKTRLTREIVTRILNDDRKFWIQKGGNWVEMDDDAIARKKVASNFRDEKKRRAEACTISSN